MFNWFNRVSIKQLCVLLLREIKRLDSIDDEIYENLNTLAEAINEIEDGSAHLSYNQTTQYLEFGTQNVNNEN